MLLEEAKQLYMKYGCSLQTMFREEHDKYILYRETNIDEEIEQNWKKEYVFQIVSLMKETGDIKNFDQLCELIISVGDKSYVELIMIALKTVDIDNSKKSLSIAESILGRKMITARSGMIFFASRHGEFDLAFELVEMVDKLIASVEELELQGRKKKIMENLQKVKEILCIEKKKYSNV